MGSRGLAPWPSLAGLQGFVRAGPRGILRAARGWLTAYALARADVAKPVDARDLKSLG